MNRSQPNDMSTAAPPSGVRNQTLEVPARTCFAVAMGLGGATAMLVSGWLRDLANPTIVGVIALLVGATLAWRYLQYLDRREENALRQHHDRLRLDYDFLEVEPRTHRRNR